MSAKLDRGVLGAVILGAGIFYLVWQSKRASPVVTTTSGGGGSDSSGGAGDKPNDGESGGGGNGGGGDQGTGGNNYNSRDYGGDAVPATPVPDSIGGAIEKFFFGPLTTIINKIGGNEGPNYNAPLMSQDEAAIKSWNASIAQAYLAGNEAGGNGNPGL